MRQPVESTSSLSRGAYHKSASAAQIFFDFARNEIQADAQYKGQRLSLGGKIHSIISKDGVGIVEIRVVPVWGADAAFWRGKSNNVYFMHAHFPDPSVLIPYRAGGEIAFNGSIEGVHGNILDVKDCYLPR
jgi:starvation-inducible outer membrane lipoprotein